MNGPRSVPLLRRGTERGMYILTIGKDGTFHSRSKPPTDVCIEDTFNNICWRFAYRHAAWLIAFTIPVSYTHLTLPTKA